MGRILFENVIGSGFAGPVYAVNPNHRRVLARRSYASTSSIGKPVDLALIATPADAVPAVLQDAARVGVKAAVIVSAAPPGVAEAKRWNASLATIASTWGLRLSDRIRSASWRTAIGLNPLWQHPRGVGPSCPGRAIGRRLHGDARFRAAARPRLLDRDLARRRARRRFRRAARRADRRSSRPTASCSTLEQVREARRFLSALRAAARAKPRRAAQGGTPMEPPRRPAVAGCRVRRGREPRGTVRVQHVHAALRCRAHARVDASRKATASRSSRTGAVRECSRPTARTTPASSSRASRRRRSMRSTRVCGRRSARANPVDVRGDAPPERLAGGRVAVVLADASVDAVVALHVPRPVDAPVDAARAVADVARHRPSRCSARGSARSSARSARGARGRRHRELLHAGERRRGVRVPRAYRRHQELAARSPRFAARAARARPRRDRSSAHRCPHRAAHCLDAEESPLCCRHSACPCPLGKRADTLAEANAAARRLGFPVTLRLASDGVARRLPGSGADSSARQTHAGACVGGDA